MFFFGILVGLAIYGAGANAKKVTEIITALVDKIKAKKSN
jgi:hypothetical protein